MQGRDRKSNRVITQHRAVSLVYDGEDREKLFAEQMIIAKSTKSAWKAGRQRNPSVKTLIIILICCIISVAVLASCESEPSERRIRYVLDDNYGELLATIDITDGKRHFVYKIHENTLLTRGDINFPIPPEFAAHKSESSYSGSILTRSERRQIRRLLNEVLENEQGVLGLLDSGPHVTIRQGEIEINFTYGMADIKETDELISKVLDLFSVEIVLF